MKSPRPHVSRRPIEIRARINQINEEVARIEALRLECVDLERDLLQVRHGNTGLVPPTWAVLTLLEIRPRPFHELAEVLMPIIPTATVKGLYILVATLVHRRIIERVGYGSHGILSLRPGDRAPVHPRLPGRPVSNGPRPKRKRKSAPTPKPKAKPKPGTSIDRSQDPDDTNPTRDTEP